MICNDCVPALDKGPNGHGVIQFCYTHQHAKDMRQILMDFSVIMDKEEIMEKERDDSRLWFALRAVQLAANRILYGQ